MAPPGSHLFPYREGNREQVVRCSGNSREQLGTAQLRGCPICDLVEQGRLDLGERQWVHDRSVWSFADQDYMARAHALEWDFLRGGWVPIREKTYRVRRWLYDDVYEWIEEEKERDR